MTTDSRMKTPGPDHPITISRSDAHVVVRSGDRVLADSARTLELAEAAYPVVHYVPIGDVDREQLTRTQTSTYCPYKGEASYWSVVGGETDSVWTYEQPYSAVEEIAGHVAFYPDRVQIEVVPKGA